MVTSLVRNCHEALRLGGRLIVLDPIWDNSPLAGRILWALDRGSFPKESHQLRQWVGADFSILTTETFQIWHRYHLVVGEKA